VEELRKHFEASYEALQSIGYFADVRRDKTRQVAPLFYEPCGDSAEIRILFNNGNVLVRESRFHAIT